MILNSAVASAIYGKIKEDQIDKWRSFKLVCQNDELGQKTLKGSESIKSFLKWSDKIKKGFCSGIPNSGKNFIVLNFSVRWK